MDDSATPTPTPSPAPTLPPKSIDGMRTPPPAMPTNDAAVPTAIDINKLDGDSLDVSPSPSTNDMGTPPASSSSMDKPSVPMDDAADETFTIPKPGTTFDAKAAQAAMNEEDNKESESLNPEKTRLGSTKYPPTSPKKKGRGLAIVIAVIIALALIGGASYAFWKNNKDKKTTTKDTTETTINITETITTASDGIDAELSKVDDTKEFQSTDLSDATLGL